MRLLAVVEYDGTHFAGFQLQANPAQQLRTVQSELERAIGAACGATIRISASGRTDAGVHATGQVIHFDTDVPLLNDLPRFHRAINARLAQTARDVSVHALQMAPDGFHARYSAYSRTYRYRVINEETPSPLWRHYAHHIRRPLAVSRMAEAARLLVGDQDFVAFAAHQSPGATRREVFGAEVTEIHDDWAKRVPIWQTLRRRTTETPGGGSLPDAHGVRLIDIEIEANAFLRHMMRRIAGTLIRVGQGSLEPAEVASIISSKEKARAGPTAPAAGLCLERVTYGQHKERFDDEDVFA